ncbi:MAG: alpha/beta fold hydrolase [Pseudodesulfovibrio sp.]|nr:alpha/beta fold hydrolase [Pseudodesulfovibrio sp.]
MRLSFLILLILVVLPAFGHAAQEAAYPFPDSYKATVYGTPPDMAYVIEKPVKPVVEAIRIKNRKVPNVFSYSSEMFYTTALQKDDAPLIFIIAGTGAEHNSAKMKFLTQAFYQAGFHVAALSSPTHMNFLVSVSQHASPGYVPHDVNDLYRVMLWIKEDIEKERTVTDYYVTGYSLGAMHTAFLAHLDEERGDFNFRKALMINPPVSLYHSVCRLDSWLTKENLGDQSVRDEIDHFVDLFSDYYKNSEVTDLDDNFLYDLITHIDLEDKDLRALIAVDFRVSTSAMIFASDVCLQAGYLVPLSAYPLSSTTPLMPYAEASFEISFKSYMDEYLLPYLQYLDPGLDRWTMIKQCSLYEISDYLKKTDKVVLVGNVNDPILDEHDLAFIGKVFGDRATLFPSGGHCGNIMYGPFVEKMLELVSP